MAVVDEERYFLIIDGDRKARIVKPRPYSEPKIKADETAFKLTIEFPARRRISGEIALTIQENVVTVDGVEMIPLNNIIVTVP